MICWEPTKPRKNSQRSSGTSAAKNAADRPPVAADRDEHGDVGNGVLNENCTAKEADVVDNSRRRRACDTAAGAKATIL